MLGIVPTLEYPAFGKRLVEMKLFVSLEELADVAGVRWHRASVTQTLGRLDTVVRGHRNASQLNLLKRFVRVCTAISSPHNNFPFSVR